MNLRVDADSMISIARNDYEVWVREAGYKVRTTPYSQIHLITRSLVHLITRFQVYSIPGSLVHSTLCSQEQPEVWKWVYLGADLPTVETGWEIGIELHYIFYTNYLRIETALHAEPA
jgi:hypothetical protein